MRTTSEGSPAGGGILPVGWVEPALERWGQRQERSLHWGPPEGTHLDAVSRPMLLCPLGTGPCQVRTNTNLQREERGGSVLDVA